MENELKLRIKKKKEENGADKNIRVSAEMGKVLEMYSKETGMPLKMLADILLKFALDHMTIVFEDDE